MMYLFIYTRFNINNYERVLLKIFINYIRMNYKFDWIAFSMNNMILRIARISFISNQSSFEYLKKSLYVLIRQIDIHDNKIRQQNLDQQNFLVDQFHHMKRKIDDRFTQMKHQINDEFEKMKQKMKKNMNEKYIVVKKNISDVKRNIVVFKQNIKNQFRAIEKNINKHNDKMNNMNMKFRNNFVIINNDCIRRFHESIKIVKVFTIDFDLDKLKWKFHFNVSKHLKEIYVLKQQTKNIFDFHSKLTFDAQSKCILF